MQVPDLISGGAPTSITAALVRVDSGDVTNISGDVTNISGFTNMEIPASARTGNTRVCVQEERRRVGRGRQRELKSVRSKPGNHVPVGGAGHGDLASTTGAKIKRRAAHHRRRGGGGLGCGDAAADHRDGRRRGRCPGC